MMSGSKGLFASSDMAKCTNAYSDAQGAPLSQRSLERLAIVSLETKVSNDTLVSAPQRITHNLGWKLNFQLCMYAISKP